MFSGLSDALNSMTGGSSSGVASIVEGNITQKTWEDVQTLLPYVIVGLALAVLFSKMCNLMTLEDKTARGLGVNVNLMRILISLVAVLLASISTAVAGAFTFLLADTIGRTVAAPYEVSASIIMSVIGGPFFIILLRRSKKYAA